MGTTAVVSRTKADSGKTKVCFFCEACIYGAPGRTHTHSPMHNAMFSWGNDKSSQSGKGELHVLLSPLHPGVPISSALL